VKIGYIDSSIIISEIEGERSKISELTQLDQYLSSELLRVECFRALDRMRIDQKYVDEEIAYRTSLLRNYLDAIRLVKVDSTILNRASESFPTRVRTLDAIHLATAILIREQAKGKKTETYFFFTHHRALGIAAQALGFEVKGF